MSVIVPVQAASSLFNFSASNSGSPTSTISIAISKIVTQSGPGVTIRSTGFVVNRVDWI